MTTDHLDCMCHDIMIHMKHDHIVHIDFISPGFGTTQEHNYDREITLCVTIRAMLMFHVVRMQYI